MKPTQKEMDRKCINIIMGYLKIKTELISYIMNG
jgi:hypothetical protein